MIVWSPEAEADLQQTFEVLAGRDAKLARQRATALFDVIEGLATELTIGSRHVLKSGDVVSGWSQPPFRIYYQAIEDALYVVRVYCDAY